jgi:hypothetical protein
MQTKIKNKGVLEPSPYPLNDPVLDAPADIRPHHEADPVAFLESAGWENLPDRAPNPTKTWKDPKTSGWTSWFYNQAEAIVIQMLRDGTKKDFQSGG